MCLLPALAGCGAEPPILVEGFRTGPPALPVGWTTRDRARNALQRTDDGRLAITGGFIESPTVAVELGRCYMVHVTASGSGRGFWEWTFRREDGSMVSSIVKRIEPTDETNDNNHPVRAADSAVAATLRIWNDSPSPVAIDQVRIDPISRDRAMRWYDDLDASLPRFAHCQGAGAERDMLLPQTMRRLRAGETLRIVILGDSYMNDLASSGFIPLLERQYPKAGITLLPVVANSAGAWHWMHEDRIAKQVLPLKPDLVIFGGISSSVYSADDIDVVVGQLRAGGVNEILLTHDAPANVIGSPLERQRGWEPTMHEEQKGYAGNLYRMAKQQKVALADVAGPVVQAIHDCGEGADHFMRDGTHFNARGRQLMARALACYFKPRDNTDRQ